MTRFAATLALLAGVVLVLAPFAPWFSAPTPAGSAGISGWDASATLLTVAVAGLTAATVALGLLTGRVPPGPVAGGGLLALGAVALLWTVRVAVDPPVTLVARMPDGDRAVPVEAEPLVAAHVAPAAAALLALSGAALLARSRMRAGRT